MKTCVELIWTDLIESEIVLDETDKKKEKIDATSSVLRLPQIAASSIAEFVKRGRLNITFRPQIAASSTLGFVVWAVESAIVQIRWLGVWLLWAQIRIPDAWRILARICRARFQITFGFESLVRVRFKVEMILYSCAGCF